MFYVNKKMSKTGLAGIFAASLELVKEGSLKILQKDLFKNVMIKKLKDENKNKNKNKDNVISFPQEHQK